MAARSSRSDLLDRREQPVTAMRAHEGPQFRHVGRLTGTAADDDLLPAAAARLGQRNHIIDRAPAQPGGGVFELAFAPGLLQIALQERHPLDAVLDALAG